jgi:hypothetical protein
MNASEVVERNMKTTHENHHLLTNLHRLENELTAAKNETLLYQQEISTLRDKCKSFHTNQLSSEKKATEMLSLNSKLQVSLNLV